MREARLSMYQEGRLAEEGDEAATLTMMLVSSTAIILISSGGQKV
jgi:hypothetical protein